MSTDTPTIGEFSIVAIDEVSSYIENNPSDLWVVDRLLLGEGNNFLRFRTLEEWLDGNEQGGFGTPVESYGEFLGVIKWMESNDPGPYERLTLVPRREVARGTNVFIFRDSGRLR